MRSGRQVQVAPGSKELPLVSRVLAEERDHWSDTLIWAKDRFVLGRADYQRAYEPLWYGWHEGSEHYWCGDRDQGDVWQIARPDTDALHPAMKPLPFGHAAERKRHPAASGSALALRTAGPFLVASLADGAALMDLGDVAALLVGVTGLILVVGLIGPGCRAGALSLNRAALWQGPPRRT